MNGSWKNCTQRRIVTSRNWKERKCDCQGTVCSGWGWGWGGGAGVMVGVVRQYSLTRKLLLTPGRMPAHKTKPASRSCSFSTGFSELAQLSTPAEQVSKGLGEGKSARLYRVQHGFVVAVCISLEFWDKPQITFSMPLCM